MIDRIIIISLLISMCYSACPPNKITNPCVCRQMFQWKYLYCAGHQYYNMDQICLRMSKWFTNHDDKKFHFLWFDSINIASLEKISFYDISFERIWIIDTLFNYRVIYQNASELTVKDYHVSN